MPGKSLPRLILASSAALAAAFALVFGYSPLDSDQGLIQKIFYLHVPLAIVSLCGFMAGGIMAGGHPRTGGRRWDGRFLLAVHLSILFAGAAPVTGSILAQARWGHWGGWDEAARIDEENGRRT